MLLHDYAERIVLFLHENMVAIGTMATGVAVGETDVHKHLGDYLTDPTTVSLIKDYIGILCTLGGFSLMVYNTLFKKKKVKNQDNGPTE